MATQGAFANAMYAIDINPATKIPRDSKNSPANALIEVKEIVGHDGMTHRVQIYGLDGAAGIATMINGRRTFVPLIAKLPRRRPPHRVLGEYQFPDDSRIPNPLRGLTISIRLDGLTLQGRPRPQYLRWINEHTDFGREFLGQRNSTESIYSLLEAHLAPGARARSVGEFRVTLDLIGFHLTRNHKAGLAHTRRTGRRVERGVDPPPWPTLVAPAA